MAKKTAPQTKKEPRARSGVGLKRFEAALKAVELLEESGKLLVLSDPTGSVRFVLDERGDFAKTYREQARPKKVTEADADEVLREIRGFLQLALFTKAEGHRRHILESDVFSDVEQLPAAEKKRRRAEWTKKFTLIEQQAVYRRLSNREKRLKSSITPCVVEADAELVRERRVGRDNSKLDVPFLRIGLRYTGGGESGFFGALVRGHPWDDFSGLLQIKTFEFDCDLADIDLLIRRLLAAKVLLAGHLEGEDAGSD